MGCTVHLRSMGQRDFGRISEQTMSSASFVSCRLKRYAMVPAIFAAVAIAVPFLLHSIPILGFALQRGFALICHQQAERSFLLFSGSVAVCARCLGIYLGVTAGLLVRLPRAIAVRWLTAAVVLNLRRLVRRDRRTARQLDACAACVRDCAGADGSDAGGEFWGDSNRRSSKSGLNGAPGTAHCRITSYSSDGKSIIMVRHCAAAATLK